MSFSLTPEVSYQNALAESTRTALNEQSIQSNEMEVMARAAGGLLGIPDEAQRAAAYPGLVADLRRQGFAARAPDAYPGEQALQRLLAMGVPAATQYEQGVSLQGSRNFRNALFGPDPPAQPGPGATPTAPPGGTGTAPVGRPFTWANLPAGITPEIDQLVRTVYGEAGGEPVTGQQAVVHVVNNRRKVGNQSVEDVVFAPGQFEPWGNPQTRAKLEALDPSDPAYQRILKEAVLPVLNGQTQDPTDGATHFYSPKTQAALGRPPPSWAFGGGMSIGNHDFYKPGYAPRTQVAQVPPRVTTDVPPTGGPPAPGTTARPQQQTTGGLPPPPPGSGLTPPIAPEPIADPRLGLTAQQLASVKRRADAIELLPPKSRAAAQQAVLKEVEDYAEKNRQDRLAYPEKANKYVADVQAHGEKEERLGFARQDAIQKQAKADRDAVQANNPYPGDTADAADNNRLIAGSQRGEDGEYTPEAKKIQAGVEYANSFARQRRQKTDSGVAFDRDMSMFATPGWKPATGQTTPPDPNADPDAPGGRNYGVAKSTVGPDPAKLRDAETSATGLLTSLENFRKASKEAGLMRKVWTAAGIPTTLAGAWTSAALLAKGDELFRLGVITGPDLKLMQKVLPDPSTVGGAFASHEVIDQAVDTLSHLINVRLDAMRNYGRPGSGTGGDRPATTTPPANRPPLSSFGR